MKILPTMATKKVLTKTPQKIKRGLALATPLLFSAKEAVAHPSLIHHTHDHHGNTVGMAAGILLLLTGLITGVIALYRTINDKSNKAEEIFTNNNLNKK